MQRVMQLLFGVIPACLLTMMGIAFAGLASSTLQKILIAGAVIGTCGLIWSLVGYSRKAAAVVLCALLVGIAGALSGGLIAVVTALGRYDQLGMSATLLQLLLASWICLGPAIVGILQARRAAQRLRTAG